MKYQHCFRVHAPLERVADFHSRAASMKAITPPPIVVQIQRAAEIQRDGDEIEFTLWLGPLPVHWLARIEQVSSSGFADRQARGPFRAWVHRHSFIVVDAHTTEVMDEVQAELRSHALWGPVGWGLWIGLPLLFAYRACKTKRLLERL